jgi:pimeloyl-ACP methyl ester carboxylesterase
MNETVKLHVADDGDPSAPPILLLHGVTMSTRTWDWLVPVLADRFHLLRLDFRGHGESDRAPGGYGPAGYMGDAVAVLETLGRPAVVVGHSLGGGTAAALVQRRPDLLVGAVMEDPALLPRATEGTPRARSLLEGFRAMRRSIPRLQGSGMSVEQLVEVLSAAPDTTRRSTFIEALEPDAIEAMAYSMLHVDAAVLDPALNGSSPAFLDPAAPFGVPSVIVCADPSLPDAVSDPEVARRFAAQSPDVEVAIVSGAGHLIHDEKASRPVFLSHLQSLLERVRYA